MVMGLFVNSATHWRIDYRWDYIAVSARTTPIPQLFLVQIPTEHLYISVLFCQIQDDHLTQLTLFLAQLTAVLLPVTLLSVIVIGVVGAGVVGIVKVNK